MEPSSNQTTLSLSSPVTIDSDDDIDDTDIVDLTADLPEDKKPKIIVGIDPGPVNCGVCEYDIENDIPLALYHISFRGHQKKEDGIKIHNLIEAVRNFILDKYDGWKEKNAIIGVEDQIAGRLEKREFGNINGETDAIQYGIQALLGKNMCTSIAPRLVKCHFRQFFPKVEEISGETSFDKQKRQYRSDKNQALKEGQDFVPLNMKIQFKSYALDKNIKIDKTVKPDPYDALWICKYMSDTVKGRPSYSQIKKQKKKEESQKRREESKKKREEEKKNKSTPKKRKSSNNNNDSFTKYINIEE